MNEAKSLLNSIIENQLSIISKIDIQEFSCDGINLVELYNSINDNYEHLYLATDSIIDKIIDDTNYKNKASFKKDIKKIRDLLIGKKDYKLNVTINKDYQTVIDTFIKILGNYLEEKLPGMINYEEIEKECLKLKKAILSNGLITNFEFIERITKEYDEINYSQNIIMAMDFINKHNIAILKNKKYNEPLFDVHLIIKPKLDDKIKEILDKFEIKQKELPNYLLSELKKCDVQEVYETFITLKKNKAEDYGLLHLIRKDNNLAKLVMVLYATSESIKSVVDSTKDSRGNIDIAVLRVLINNLMSCFLVKDNNYYSPKNKDFLLNIKLLKDNCVNYKALIIRNPIFMISNNEVLNYTLKYLENAGANKKNIINRGYKILSLNPVLLIDNIEIMRKFNINLMEYFSEENINYNLLKTSNLEDKLNYITTKYKLKNSNPLDFNLVNKILVTIVYQESLGNKVDWSGYND